MSGNSGNTLLTVGLAQIAPVWLQKQATIEKVAKWTADAAAAGCKLVAFGEALVPGYPFWVERTNGAEFNSALQKSLYAHYASQAVDPQGPDLDPVRKAAAENSIAVYLGTIERATDRGGHSLYCSLVYIDPQGKVLSVHRKLMPTYEERLVWSIGDGNGLQTHPLGAFTVGGLNCWENWLPLVRSSLYGLGEDLHIAVWPGGIHNTQDISRFIALEGRSYVLSVSGLMRASDIDPALPHSDVLRAAADEVMADGGSCLVDPSGQFLIEPHGTEEILLVAEIDHQRVLEERQNMDPSGHYSRPDVTALTVDRKRQATVNFED